MTGDVSHVEIGAQKATPSRTFFEQLFGWQFHAMGDEGEGYFQTPTIKAGLHGNDPDPAFLIFFGVSDLSAAIDKVKQLGGTADDQRVADRNGST